MKQNQIAEISISYTPSRYNQAKIQTTEEAYNVLKEFFAKGTIALQEQFVVMYLNACHKVLGIYTEFNRIKLRPYEVLLKSNILLLPK